MLYQINKGVKFYGTQSVLDGVQFSVNEQEKIAIVGRNGAGKTTLLKIMMQEVALESGEIHQSGKLEIGYLSQHVFANEQQSVKDVMYEVFLPLQALERELQQMEKDMEHDHSEAMLESYAARSHTFEMQGGYTYHTEIMTLFTKFGFDPADFTKPLHAFSGGQKTRLGLIRLLLSKPDILLLDEPTNHLDLETIAWLEGYLKRYPKAIVLVSHDRKFIDNIATSIWEIEFGKMKQYPGNYTQFVQQKKAYQERMHSTFVRQSKEIARIEGQIEKFRYKSSKAAFAQSKIKYLERMDKVDEVHTDEKVFNAHFTSKVKGGKQVLVLDELSIGYEQELARLSLDLYAGSKVAILGPNGCGKSTLLKTVAGKIDSLAGEFMLGHQIMPGYFDQDVSGFVASKSVLQELWDDFPALTQTQVRSALGAFLFEQDDVFKLIQDLSGGEKVRLLLAKLMLRQDNFLLLDEPTNHLDLLSKEALEEALQEYDGTMLFVSHDRYFISKLATALLVYENEHFVYYPMTYEEYTQAQKSQEEQKKVKEVTPDRRTERKAMAREIKKLEAQMEQLESDLAQASSHRFEEEYYNDYQKMHNLEAEIASLEEKFEKCLNLLEEYSNMMIEAGE